MDSSAPWAAHWPRPRSPRWPHRPPPPRTPRSPASTVSTDGVLADGWLRTGDLGDVTAGRVHLRGRLKDLIIRGGHNIDPAVIEDALLAHPAVTGAAAVGRPDRTSGEVPVAFVTVSAGTSAEALHAWADEHIFERAARPKRITVVPSLPLTAVGKPFKPALRIEAALARFADDLTEAGLREVTPSAHFVDGRMLVRLEGADSRAAADLLAPYDVVVEVTA